MDKKKVVVIGAWFGWLGSAILLARAWYDVTVVEKNDKVWGRANLLEIDGYRRDMWPSWYLMPDAFDRYFTAIGRKVEDYLDLQKLEPSYRVFFKQVEGQRSKVKGYQNLKNWTNYLDLYADVDRAATTFEQIESGSGDKLKAYLKSAAYQYGIAMEKFVFKNFDSIWDFMTPQLAIEWLQLNVFTKLYNYVSRFVKNENLKKLLMYPSVFLGTSPYETPALFNIMSHVDFNQWVFYPQGWIHEIPKALYQIALEEGVKFEFNTEVENIVVDWKEVKWVVFKWSNDYADEKSVFDQEHWISKVRTDVADKYKISKFDMFLLQYLWLWFNTGNGSDFWVINSYLRSNFEKDFSWERKQKTNKIISIISKFPKFTWKNIQRIIKLNPWIEPNFDDNWFWCFSANNEYISQSINGNRKSQKDKDWDISHIFIVKNPRLGYDLREVAIEENINDLIVNEQDVIYLPWARFKLVNKIEEGNNIIKYELEEIESGGFICDVSADIIISNADMRHTETQLLEPSQQTYPESYWAKQVISPSWFILYLWVDGELPQLKHHTLVFSDDWKGWFDQIFKDPQRPQDPNYYICNPSKTDPSVAPAGKENLFVLVPIAPWLDSTPESLEAYRDHIIADIAHNCGIPDLADRIEVSQIFSIPQFEQYYNAYKGTALWLAHTFFQSAVRRPQNYSKKVKGLYYAGGYTTPGIGMPMCLISAMMVADRVEKNK